MEEKIFFSAGNVSVSNSRFIVNGQTYAMNGVTSVKTGRKNPSRMGPILLGIIAAFLLLSGSVGRFIFGALLSTLAVFVWRNQKPELTVVLNSSSGEAKALTSSDAGFINGVIAALNNSIVHRG